MLDGTIAQLSHSRRASSPCQPQEADTSSAKNRNKLCRWERGAYENDRPPVLGVIGRESGQVRLRVVMHTKAATLEEHVHSFTLPDCHIYTDEYDSYNGIQRTRSCVAHGLKEWACDDDGDGIREIHTNTAEGMWTGLRNFLRPFRGVRNKYLSGYVAVHECRINLKRISPAFRLCLDCFSSSRVFRIDS